LVHESKRHFSAVQEALDHGMVPPPIKAAYKSSDVSHSQSYLERR
jgi:hypothetical protein